MIRKYSSFLCTTRLAGFLVSGCALSRYGRLQIPERSDAVTIQELLKTWEDYEIHFAGLNTAHPSAVLFDPKGDDQGFLTERWFKVEDKDMLDDLVDSIQRQMPIGGYSPRLWKVIGPNSQLYGYMFTSWNHAVLKAVDENTLFVYDLPMPPYLEIDGDASDVRAP